MSVRYSLLRNKRHALVARFTICIAVDRLLAFRSMNGSTLGQRQQLSATSREALPTNPYRNVSRALPIVYPCRRYQFGLRAASPHSIGDVWAGDNRHF